MHVDIHNHKKSSFSQLVLKIFRHHNNLTIFFKKFVRSSLKLVSYTYEREQSQTISIENKFSLYLMWDDLYTYWLGQIFCTDRMKVKQVDLAGTVQIEFLVLLH